MLKRIDEEGLVSDRPLSQDSAREALLIHVSDDEPGITRRRSGTGFSYRAANGKPVSDRKTIYRIKSLVIPPAWTDVWISSSDDGHIQATGRDVRGRKQYRYHERWSLSRGDAKFSSLAAFADALPAIRAQVDADLRRHDVPREKVVASVVWLLDNTMIRVGNAAYARDNKSFGLTTLRSRHLMVDGSKLRFAFKGKSNKEWRLQLVDRRMAKIIRQIQELPGQGLFQYIDEGGARRPIGSQDVNAYLRESSGSAFTSKHFRTWGATIHAASLFGATPVPESKAGQARAMNAVIDTVASRLGNTRSVCRSSYIHPLVMQHWLQGTLERELAEARRAHRKAVEGLDEEELVARTWLLRNATS